MEKKEFGNIVDGVNNLISAFQQDSGIACECMFLSALSICCSYNHFEESK